MNTPIDSLQDLCCAPYPNGIEPAIAAGMTECRFATEGGVIHYWVSASPSPKRGWMVFLPGLSADHTLFNLQFGHFAQKWNLIVWDAPAHGLSRPWNRPLSIDSMAETLGAILEKNRAVNPIIAGQSLGGYVAQAFIDLYPGCTRAFIAIDTSPMQLRYYKKWQLDILRHMEGLCRLWGTDHFLRNQMAHVCSTTPYGRRNMLQQLERYSKRELCALLGDGYRALADAVAQDRAYTIACPLMIICGTQDKAGFVTAYDKTWSINTGVPITWVEGAGHNSNVDGATFVNAAIDQFIDSSI